MIKQDQIDNCFKDFFQNLDSDKSWLDHEPKFEWTEDDYAEFEWERRVEENDRLSMAAWWEDEGVRCATLDRNPSRNPYL